MDAETACREVAYFMGRLYEGQLTTTSGGNVSVRAAGGAVAVTRAGGDKGKLTPDDVAVVDLKGNPLRRGVPPSSEAGMHLAIYQRCPEVQGIVHAHPITACAFACAQTPIDCELLAESYAIIGRPAVAEYHITASEELANAVAEKAAEAAVVLMRNHGVTTTGATLLQAFDRLELIEAAAKMTLITRQLDGVTPLTPGQMAELDRLMGRG
jgi:L-fuculose-phosphate aldolase